MRGSPTDQPTAYEGFSGSRESRSRGVTTIRPDSEGRVLRSGARPRNTAPVCLVAEPVRPPVAPQDEWHWRVDWAKDLDQLLGKFQGRVVVLGSGVMNLGSVQSFRAMAKACAESWGEADRVFDEARDHNQRLGGKPALVRTLVAHAEMHRILGSDQAKERADAAAQEAAELARALRMEPWRHRAEAVLERRSGDMTRAQCAHPPWHACRQGRTRLRGRG